MAKRDSILLRIDPTILAALKRWAEDDLRSTNGQIEFLLRDILLKSGRLRTNVQSLDTENDSQTAPSDNTLN